MKSLLTTLLLTTTFFTPAIAAEYSLPSSIDAVTVYPRGAQVLRVAVTDIGEGTHVVLVDDLPGGIIANSVRVEALSDAELEIGSVDVRQVFVSGEDRSSERAKIEREIEKLNDEIDVLDEEVNNANTRRSILQGLASQAVLPRRGANGGVVISADELDSLMAMTAGQFAEISKTTGKAQIRRREITKDIEKLQNRMSELAPRQELRSVVSVNLTSGSAGRAEFRIRYNVTEAGWTPVYDAKLTLGANGKDSRMKIVRRADVKQATSEIWENVALTLSTARPSGKTQAPELSSYILRERPKIVSKRKRDGRLSEILSMAESPVSEDQVAMARAMKPKKQAGFKQVDVKFAGFLAEYNIPGLVDVPNLGANKNVVIGARDLAADIAVRSVPILDPAAYLSASFTVESKAPWLPGVVLLSRDGVFLGKGRLPLVNSGQKHTLGFGRDDLVEVKRVKVSEKKGESGFISTSNVAERKFVTTIKNLHDFDINVTVQDQLPYGTHEDISVELMPGLSKASVSDVDKKRGVLAWENTIVAGGEKVIEFGYTVSWPKEMNITPVK